ncbi:hypothetical protein GH714_041473 [Hevea brasiliensis]|uniref:Non-haem dioxygenase N-terminal domain-containing protein n=1 Tax=Hevea brasiliensis TaxID=3981 RepID=A0A6A6MW53_HEVBR|nr:hypothetical protein GH714_041473 [Hevea brasiliensis]
MGMTSSFLDEVRLATKKFFALPMEEKHKYAREVDGMEGYGNDMILSESVLDWNDRLYLLASPEDQRQLRYWPESPANFRETLFEYTSKLRLITEASSGSWPESHSDGSVITIVLQDKEVEGPSMPER